MKPETNYHLAQNCEVNSAETVMRIAEAEKRMAEHEAKKDAALF